MNTTNNNQNIESKNGESQVINYTFEIVRDFDGTYYANVHNELHEHFRGLPEYVTYKELKKAVKEALGVTLPALIDLHFEKSGRKRYAQVYDLQGVRVEQPAMAFGLRDKVVLGAFGERRFAVGCIVTGYKWDVATGQFLYILQGEDGQQYTDFERNIIADKGEAALQHGREISDRRKQDGLPVGEGELVMLKEYGGALGFITKVNGDELTFRHISGNWTAHPRQDEVARIEDVRPSWCQKGQTVKYDGKVYVIEIVDFFGDIEHSLESEHVCCICEQGKECICQNCRDVRWECLTPCTPDGRDLLPEPPAEIVIGEEPTLEPASEIKAVCIEGVSLTAEKRTKWVKNFGDTIREHATEGRETLYSHDCGCIRVEVAYRNDSDKPEDMTYCVSWYKWLDIETEKRELVECENGIRLEQAARAMADFHLLADAGLTLQQILYPAA